jgi:hypothetical protein
MQKAMVVSYRRRLLGSFLIVASIVVLAVVLMLVPNQTTSNVCACTPPPGGLPSHTIAERTNAADVVLAGTVITVMTDYPPAFIIAIVEVDHYYKSTGPEIVTISNLGPESLCLSWVDVGDQRIFFTIGDPYTGLRAHYVSQFDAVVPISPEVVEQVIIAVCHEMAEPCTQRVYMPLFSVAE